jgi:hypothetical protein
MLARRWVLLIVEIAHPPATTLLLPNPYLLFAMSTVHAPFAAMKLLQYSLLAYSLLPLLQKKRILLML